MRFLFYERMYGTQAGTVRVVGLYNLYHVCMLSSNLETVQN
jgi:hypothetical protein